MPIYEYEHAGKDCKLGKVFEVEGSFADPPLERCPSCGGPVRKLISTPILSFPKSNSDLKGLGFSKLVRRDHGVYENVTAQDYENKIVDLGDKSTYPDLKKSKRKK